MERSTLKSMKFGKEKLKNIWFFYKKHIIIGGILLIVGVFLLIQCATNRKNDLTIYYAGDGYLTQEAQKKLQDAFEAVVPKELAEKIGFVTTTIGQNITVKGTDEENKQHMMNYTGQKETLDDFKSRMRLPDTVICILSPDCFNTACADTGTLRPLTELLDSLPEGTTENGMGIYLQALPFYKSNSILKAFDGCVLCVKSASVFREKDEYDRQIEAFRAIVGYAPIH